MYHIIHHTDADGFCSAAIVHYFLTKEKKVSPNDINLVPINYGMRLRDEKYDYESDNFFMVDFSLQPAEKMVEFCKKTGNRLVWIDHHDTAFEVEKKHNLSNVRGLREPDCAGCELTWVYFSDEKIPRMIELIGAWDTWRRDNPKVWEEEVLPFQLFLKSFDSRPTHNMTWWVTMLDHSRAENHLFSDIMADSLRQGRTLKSFVDRQDSMEVQSKAYRGKFAGYSAVLINRGGSSLMFEKNEEAQKADLWITYTHTKGRYWTVSLYSDKPEKVHCGKLAKKLGEAGPLPSGGGHAKAAGFQTTWEYFWNLVEVDE